MELERSASANSEINKKNPFKKITVALIQVRTAMKSKFLKKRVIFENFTDRK